MSDGAQDVGTNKKKGIKLWLETNWNVFFLKKKRTKIFLY